MRYPLSGLPWVTGGEPRLSVPINTVSWSTLHRTPLSEPSDYVAALDDILGRHSATMWRGGKRRRSSATVILPSCTTVVTAFFSTSVCCEGRPCFFNL
jgi:hypothetical protein